MGSTDFSDYGSGESSNSSWGSRPKWLGHTQMKDMEKERHKSSSFIDLMTGNCTIEDVMKEFRMNGFDSPYNPDEDKIWRQRPDDLIGMGPSSTYLRQKSWPEPDRTPVTRLQRPASEWTPSPTATEFTPTPPGFNPTARITDVPDLVAPTIQKCDVITEEQLRVLSTLPNTILYTLLKELQQDRGEPAKTRKRQAEECRFCKNNGERETYYRSHSLKDAGGRVACPVLRAFVCKRCGASGDRAHTIKYCPLSTNEERIKSAAMMRSVRLASGRRRNSAQAPSITSAGDHYVMFGETTPSVIQDNNVYNAYGEAAPLDPLWAALEQKLLL